MMADVTMEKKNIFFLLDATLGSDSFKASSTSFVSAQEKEKEKKNYAYLFQDTSLPIWSCSS
jgi:hypothetical protein